MTRREAMAEASRRSGATPAQTKRAMEKIALMGAWPWDPNEQLAPDEAEKFIRHALRVKMQADFLAQTSPEFNRQMEAKEKSMREKN